MATDRQLDPRESIDLSKCEAVIGRHLRSFVEVGKALARIRDGKLYRATHQTFEAYCREKWSLSRPHSYQLITAARVVTEMSSREDISRIPENEKQARALAKIKDPAARADVWMEVLGNTETEVPIPVAEIERSVRSHLLHGESGERKDPNRDQALRLANKIVRSIRLGDIDVTRQLLSELQRSIRSS